MTRQHGLMAVLSACCVSFGTLDVHGQGAKKGKPGEVNTPPAFAERKTTKLKVGDAAPDFVLLDLKRTREVKLLSFQGKKPVVLIFGSYT